MNTEKFEITVNNMPSGGVEGYKYLIVRACDGDFWYYGEGNDYERCREISREIKNGAVIEL